jgi:hypothetical protein
MKTEEKRAARAAYKERKQVAGIFAIRCAPSGEVWVGQTLTLLTVQNRLWFMLTHGRPESHQDMSTLRAAWSAHGPDSLGFEELERIDDEEILNSPYVRDTLLKERLAHWIATLGAVQI